MQRRMSLAVLSAAMVVLSTTGVAHGAEQPVQGQLYSQDIATQGVGSPYYRIPALTKTNAGTLLAAYDARPTLADLPGNLSVVLRRSTDDGVTWQAQQVVRKEAAPKGFGDPSLLVDRETGRIFVFYAASVNQGFFGSATGNDENDPNVLQADYSYSDDDGLTWKHERITAEIKNPAWAGMFAASGEGIQLRHGTYKGRLIQQYAIRNNNANYAVSAYSDDHGATWKMGNPVGPGGDENKTVELSDGRIMLNNRSAPYRTVAYSTDGGVNYTPFQQDTELPDPANNGSVMRFAPNVDASHPRAKWLMFSNTATTNSRSNLTVRLSCDNGQNWPVRKVVNAGSSAYSTLTPLTDGTGGNPRTGLLWERDNYRHITYSSFDLQWLGGVCAPVTVTPPASLPAGRTTEVTVRVVSQNDVTLPGGSVSLSLPAGWSAPTVAVPALNPGQGANMKIPVTVPASAAAGKVPATATYLVRGWQRSHGETSLTVTAP
ncbi:exo-alpha-sialidase [Streptomyces pristinaespiralis]|uniref:exo-alpha-sialidase n=2 Tax=Streptomyces pristinaespiralis TaxID=38300 RepID=B5HH14_STRE2|nr:exo-alpha-sialidase [Streptomyces pristinaespiralis]ALC24628.1 neuramidase [Streptomyces pristinaespiralis]EDY66125.2 sialidase [Streptomyces pristinaespiralis ATCC 25486]QMU13037.1 exo-alpha-sialidase [Streptomyces pristinaespiralis]